jgi:hypothetical protein
VCVSQHSDLDELLAAVDVERRPGDGVIRHPVDGEAPTSSGPTTRRIGKVARSCSRLASSPSLRIDADSGVSTNPGAIHSSGSRRDVARADSSISKNAARV